MIPVYHIHGTPACIVKSVNSLRRTCPPCHWCKSGHILREIGTAVKRTTIQPELHAKGSNGRTSPQFAFQWKPTDIYYLWEQWNSHRLRSMHSQLVWDWRSQGHGLEFSAKAAFNSAYPMIATAKACMLNSKISHLHQQNCTTLSQLTQWHKMQRKFDALMRLGPDLRKDQFQYLHSKYASGWAMWCVAQNITAPNAKLSI